MAIFQPDTSTIMLPISSLILSWGVLGVNGLAGPSFLSLQRSRPNTLLSATNNDDDLNAMRSMLEASWDSDTMGQVPSDSSIAANEAFSSILSAKEKGVSVFFIDLLLPSYDVSQGSNLYDEVLAVEYCIALADCLKEKSTILVRDDNTVSTVRRILDRREEERQAALAVINISDEDETDREGEENEDESNGFSDEENEDMSDATTGLSDPESDMDSFRQQLMSSWENDDEKIEPRISERTKIPPKSEEPISQSRSPKTILSEKRYRIASLFGNARISEGPDMIDNVVKALRANALPKDDEEILIVLSAITIEEMVAVRSLVAKYESSKQIILVNCKLNPIPKELYGAETVYSILPLIARPVDADSQVAPKDGKSQPKVVVLRRYPGEWQVFVDVGKGFKLAKSAPSSGMLNRRGPPIQWVQQVVQNYMKS